jgi:hypothetical protein
VLERMFNGICELASVLPHVPFVVEAAWAAGDRCLGPEAHFVMGCQRRVGKSILWLRTQLRA